jgi:hypothetical protein
MRPSELWMPRTRSAKTTSWPTMAPPENDWSVPTTVMTRSVGWPARNRSPLEPVEDPQPSRYDAGYEMLFDAAQCLRLGQ